MLKRESGAASTSSVPPKTSAAASGSLGTVELGGIFGAVTKYENRIGNEYTALVFDNSGTLYAPNDSCNLMSTLTLFFYRTSYQVKLHEADTDVRALAGTVAARHEWTLTKSHDFSVIFDSKPTAPQSATGGANSSVEASVYSQKKLLHKQWLSNIETSQTILALEHSPYYVATDTFSLDIWNEPREDLEKLASAILGSKKDDVKLVSDLQIALLDPVKQDALLARTPHQFVHANLEKLQSYSQPLKEKSKEDRPKEKEKRKEKPKEKVVENLAELHDDYDPELRPPPQQQQPVQHYIPLFELAQQPALVGEAKRGDVGDVQDAANEAADAEAWSEEDNHPEPADDSDDEKEKPAPRAAEEHKVGPGAEAERRPPLPAHAFDHDPDEITISMIVRDAKRH